MTLVANALFSMGYISAQIAGAIVITALPPIPANNLMAIKLPIVGANALPSIQAFRNHVERMTTGYRPYISESGPRNKGPTAKPRMYIVTMRVPRTREEVWNSAIVCVIPGATIEEARGLRVEIIAI
jgi:hypothetical protein